MSTSIPAGIGTCLISQLLLVSLLFCSLILVLGGMVFFIPVFGIEKIPRYPVFHSILAVN